MSPPSALEIAADANREARFVAGSVVDLPFPDRSFDVVGCFEVLEHLPGDLPRRALSELARVARQRGGAQRAARAAVLPCQRRPREESRRATQGERPGPQAVLVTVRLLAQWSASNSSCKNSPDPFHGRSVLPRCPIDRRAIAIRPSGLRAGSQGELELTIWTFESGAAVFAVI